MTLTATAFREVPVEMWAEIYSFSIIGPGPLAPRVLRSVSRVFRSAAGSPNLMIILFRGFPHKSSVLDFVLPFSCLSNFCVAVQESASIASTIESSFLKIGMIEIFPLEPQLYEKEILQVAEVLPRLKILIVHAPSSPTPHAMPFLEEIVSAIPKLESLSLKFGGLKYDLKMVYRIHGEFRNNTSWLTDYRSVINNPELLPQCDTPFCEGMCQVCLGTIEQADFKRPWSHQGPLRTVVKKFKPVKHLQVFICKKDFRSKVGHADFFADIHSDSVRPLVRKSSRWKRDLQQEWQCEEYEEEELELEEEPVEESNEEEGSEVKQESDGVLEPWEERHISALDDAS